MKRFMLTASNTSSERRRIKMQETKAIFENEEAVRLLNYFISYKEIVSKNETHPINSVDDEVSIAVLPKSELLVVK
jgi:hypothetical protein